MKIVTLARQPARIWEGKDVPTSAPITDVDVPYDPTTPDRAAAALRLYEYENVRVKAFSLGLQAFASLLAFTCVKPGVNPDRVHLAPFGTPAARFLDVELLLDVTLPTRHVGVLTDFEVAGLPPEVRERLHRDARALSLPAFESDDDAKTIRALLDRLRAAGRRLLMGWASGVNTDGRVVGYGIVSTCDEAGCDTKIDRGLDYCCGGKHLGMADTIGCGGYFCAVHRQEMRKDGDSYVDLCATCAAKHPEPEEE